jgi:hypothetical protein
LAPHRQPGCRVHHYQTLGTAHRPDLRAKKSLAALSTTRFFQA